MECVQKTDYRIWFFSLVLIRPAILLYDTCWELHMWELVAFVLLLCRKIFPLQYACLHIPWDSSISPSSPTLVISNPPFSLLLLLSYVITREFLVADDYCTSRAFVKYCIRNSTNITNIYMKI